MENHEKNGYNNNNNNNKSPKNQDPSPSPDLSHHEVEFNNSIITNNNNNKPSLATSASSTSSELSPGHFSPSDSPLCHVSPSPAPDEAQKPSIIQSKASLATSSSSSSELSPLDSPLCHVSPSPAPAPPKRARKSLSVLRVVKREKAVKRAALGVRVFGVCFCLVSLAVMAADKDRGWALDSFYRYKEFRYCISVNVVGFLYSVAQTCDLAFTLCTGKYVLRHQYRVYFDFAMDQILTYLLMSASSSAATRVDDWESNWGKDDFPMMASISVGLSFMSFVALAASTLISGYALGTWSSS